MAKYEEHKKWNTFWSWLFIIALSGGLITWAMSMMVLIPDVPREWDFGNIEYTPGASIYSTRDATDKPVDYQKQIHLKGLYDSTRSGTYADTVMVQPLPEGIPMEEVRKAKDEE